MHATGEQVDLLTFSPVCLPSEGDNFDGSDGVVAGSQFLFAGFFCIFSFLKGWGLAEPYGNFSSEVLHDVKVRISSNVIFLFKFLLQTDSNHWKS